MKLRTEDTQKISSSLFPSISLSSSFLSPQNTAWQRGWSTVLGGFLIHLVLGTLYCWANITSAVTSYLRQYDHSVSYNDSLMVYASELVAQGCAMLLGGLLSQRIGARRACLCGSAMLLTATFSASFCRSLPALVFCQGVLFGLGIGLAYTAPIASASRWLPDRKGLVTGIVVAGFGFGAFVFGFVATSVVNPQHQSVESSGPDENYFAPSSSVVHAVPRMFRTLSVCYGACLLAGCALVYDAPQSLQESDRNGERYESAPTVDIELIANPLAARNDSESENDDEVEVPLALSPRSLALQGREKNDDGTEALRTHSTTARAPSEINLSAREMMSDPLAWHVASCMIATTVGGKLVAGTFKTFAQTEILDERFLSSITATSSIFNSLGRIVWGLSADRFGALHTLLGLSFVFSLILFTYPSAVRADKVSFALWTFSLFFFEGGNFVLYFPVVVEYFGERNAASNYGLVFSSYSLAVMLTILVASRSGWSFPALCVVMGAFTAVGFANLLLLRSHSRRAHLSRCAKRTV